MRPCLLQSPHVILAILLACTLRIATHAEAAGTYNHPEPGALWKHDNLVAWCVVPFDAKKRAPEERARMLERLGFKHFAYDWREEDIQSFDAEIEALQRHGIDLLAWWFPLDADDPQARSILETFKRHHIHPQLWVVQSANGYPRTSEEQISRVRKEADRIEALVKLARPYGSKVELYNHNDWFGRVENEIAIIKELERRGVGGVGVVYNFSHAHDDEHNDFAKFEEFWKRIEPYVVAVNVTGVDSKGDEVYPSRGSQDLTLLRTIQNSGWSGPIGLIAEQGGDAEVTLRNCITGLDWLSAELKRPGSGGARPFSAAP